MGTECVYKKKTEIVKILEMDTEKNITWEKKRFEFVPEVTKLFNLRKVGDTYYTRKVSAATWYN